MQQANGALWRIEYRTDATRTDGLVLPLGFLMEAKFTGARWLGILFRKRLNSLELDRVNMETWPELQNLESFMIGAFDDAWQAETDSDSGLGSIGIASRFSVRSALSFGNEGDAFMPSADSMDWSVTFGKLYASLLALRPRLLPALKAEGVNLPQRPARVAPPLRVGDEFELQNRAA